MNTELNKNTKRPTPSLNMFVFRERAGITRPVLDVKEGVLNCPSENLTGICYSYVSLCFDPRNSS